MKKSYNGIISPTITFPEAHCCIKCGRWMGKRASGTNTDSIDLRTFYEINWDKKGEFYYISNRTHSPLRCKLTRRKY